MPDDNIFGDSSNEWPPSDDQGPTGRKRSQPGQDDGNGFGLEAFDSVGTAGSDAFGDPSPDTFGDLGTDTFGEGGEGGGGYDEYGFSDTVDTSKCGCFPKKEELLDMDLLARHLYDLLRREAYVERERMGGW